MQKHPKFVFSCSSAQHYVWMRDFYPEIYSGILERVKSGQWVPVGGMWVETDLNLPDGEPRPSVYLKDNLHPSEAGYEEMLKVIRPAVDAAWKAGK